MLDRLKAMLIKEFIQVLRDPKMRFIIFVIPVVQILLFGYAVNTDVRKIPTAVHDLDNSTASRELIGRMTRSGYFDLKEYVGTEGRIRDLLDRGEISAAVEILPGFQADIHRGGTGRIQVVVDGTDANTARIILSHAARIAEEYGNQLLTERIVRRLGRTLPVNEIGLHSRAWFNDNLESRSYYVPGVAALMVLITTMMLSSMAVVREKEIGTMEQIIVTPIQRWEFILGKTIPFILIGYINLTIVISVAMLWFDIPFRGSLPLLYAATGLYLMNTLGFGIFISTISSTQQQAMMSSFLFTFPAMLLSGFAFPIENMPEPVRIATYGNPLRYFLVIIRGIFLKGVGFQILWPQLAALALLGTSVLTVAIQRFRKTSR